MRRSSGVAGLLLGALVIAGPAVLAVVPPSQHNVADLDLGSLVMYWTVGSALLIVPLLALTTLPGDWFERWWKNATDFAMSISTRRFAIGLVVTTFALATGFSVYCFATRPTTSDEIAQLFHARILLSGHWSLPADPNAEFFAIDNVITSPHWMSQFPIGGPVMLAMGVAVGLPWLVNPVFTAFTALWVYRFAQAAYSEAEARAAATVFVASPMVLIMGGSQMNHTPTLFFVMLALASLARWMRDDGATARNAAIVGTALGVTITIRPLDGALVSVMMGTAMLYRLARDSRRLRSVVIGAAAGAVPVAILLIANWRMTGHPFLFGYEVLWGPNHSWGLHLDPTDKPHDAVRAAILGLKYSTLLNWTLTAWPVPVLLLIAFGFAASKRTTPWDYGLLAGFVVILVAYAMYWHDGLFVGPRFLFTAVGGVLVLAARAAFMLSEAAEGLAKRVMLSVVPICVFMSWVRPMPPFGVRGITTEYREVRKTLKRAAPPDSVTSKLPRSLVFVHEGASARLTRRLWALGVSRRDASRLMQGSDLCTLLDAVRAEEKRGVADSAGRLQRIHSMTLMLGTPDQVIVPGTDPFFRVNNGSAASDACVAELRRDEAVGSSVSYGPLLLQNRFDAMGRMNGQLVYVMDLGERNELLRARFGDRQWLRYDVPPGDSVPRFIAYER